jgi:hypothetical protein
VVRADDLHGVSSRVLKRDDRGLEYEGQRIKRKVMSIRDI